jgi:hypothetical protein
VKKFPFSLSFFRPENVITENKIIMYTGNKTSHKKQNLQTDTEKSQKFIFEMVKIHRNENHYQTFVVVTINFELLKNCPNKKKNK